MSKTIEEQVEELRTSKPFTWHNNPYENTEALNVMRQALQERDRIAREEAIKECEGETERIRLEALSILKDMLSNEPSSSKMYQEFKSKILTQKMKGKMDKLCPECAHDICSGCNISCHNPDCRRMVKPQMRCYDKILGKPKQDK